jgi:hypothetical protein
VKRSSKEPKPSAESIILAYVTHPITVSLMTVLDCATDEDLTHYGTVAGAALAQLVKWAKKMPFGLSSTDELKAWFYNEHVPKRVQDLLTRIGGLLMS